MQTWTLRNACEHLVRGREPLTWCNGDTITSCRVRVRAAGIRGALMYQADSPELHSSGLRGCWSMKACGDGGKGVRKADRAVGRLDDYVRVESDAFLI